MDISPGYRHIAPLERKSIPSPRSSVSSSRGLGNPPPTPLVFPFSGSLVFCFSLRRCALALNNLPVFNPRNPLIRGSDRLPHSTPLECRAWDISPGYKHVAPLGLNAFLSFSRFLVFPFSRLLVLWFSRFLFFLASSRPCVKYSSRFTHYVSRKSPIEGIHLNPPKDTDKHPTPADQVLPEQQSQEKRQRLPIEPNTANLQDGRLNRPTHKHGKP